MNARFSSMADMAVVDLEVIKARTTVPSETMWTRSRFRDLLLERDVYCVFTGFEADIGHSVHIIPYCRGSDVRFSTLCILNGDLIVGSFSSGLFSVI